MGNDLLGISLLLVGLYITCYLSYEHGSLLIIMVGGYILRTSFALLRYYTEFMDFWGDRIYPFEKQAWEWSVGGVQQVIDNFATGPDFHTFILGLIYIPIPRSKLLVLSISVIVSTLVIRECYFLGDHLGGKKAAQLAAIIAAVFPAFILRSGTPGREVIEHLLIIRGVRFGAVWAKTDKSEDLIQSLVYLLLATAYHGALISLVVGIVIYVASDIMRHTFEVVKTSKINKSIVKNSGILFILGLLMVVIASYGFGGKVISVYNNIGEAPTIVSNRIDKLAKGRASYWGNYEISSWPELFVKQPLRIPYFLYTPFPWMVSTFKDLLGLLDATFYAIGTLVLLKSRKNIVMRRDYMIIIVMMLCFLFVFSSVANYGSAMRHRAKLAAILIPFFVSLIYQK